MKAYGIPRRIDAEYPDKADIKEYGSTATDRCARVDRGKQCSRRRWKKKERLRVKKELESEG